MISILESLYEEYQLKEIYDSDRKSVTYEKWLKENFRSLNGMFEYIGDESCIPCRNCLHLFHVDEIGSASICKDCASNEFRR